MKTLLLYFLSLSVLFLSTSLSASSRSFDWVSWGGSDCRRDYPTAAVLDESGTIYLTARTGGSGYMDTLTLSSGGLISKY